MNEKNEIHIGLMPRHDSMTTNEGGEMAGYIWDLDRISYEKLAKPTELEIDAFTWLLGQGKKLGLDDTTKTIYLYLTGLNQAQWAFLNAWTCFCEGIRGGNHQGLVVMHYNPHTDTYTPQEVRAKV